MEKQRKLEAKHLNI